MSSFISSQWLPKMVFLKYNSPKISLIKSLFQTFNNNRGLFLRACCVVYALFERISALLAHEIAHELRNKFHLIPKSEKVLPALELEVTIIDGFISTV